MNKIKQIWQRFKDRSLQVWRRVHPGARVRKGAAIGMAVLVVVFAAGIGFFTPFGFPRILDILIRISAFVFIAGILGLFVFLILRFLTALPGFVSWMGFTALIVFIFVLMILQFPFFMALLAGLTLGLAQAFLGGGIASLFDKEFKFASRPKKILIISAIAIPLTINVLFLIWLLDRGSDAHLVELNEMVLLPETLHAANPGMAGPYEVLTLTYGSGTNKRRPEFGTEAALITSSVDATPFVKRKKGLSGKLRKWYWGFDSEEFPVNGRVWHPKGDGPFPLVLVVHGNHSMQEYSDPGYAYLGELLASRGIILVSVDENFFNGSVFGDLGSENDGRGWMLLQHLKIWREWNADRSSPFFGKVDMSNIGLIGHSRGGEAAAIAGAFNRLSHYPDDATLTFDFDFDIKAIIAIAPSDQQYKPAGKPNPLENVNYLVFQGAHDSDVSLFLGMRQYNRVKFTDGGYWIKASLYSYRSNHGQFNTVWGNMDWPLPIGLLVNRKPLLNGKEQRKISKVFISAFLEYAFHDKKEYLPIFRDYRLAADWLPDDIFINRFEDSSFQPVCNFDEDVDVTSTTLSGGKIGNEHLTVWREADLRFRLRRRSKQNGAVFIGWGRPGQEELTEEIASYSIDLPENAPKEIKISRDSLLVFSLAEADEQPPEEEEEKEAEEGEIEEKKGRAGKKKEDGGEEIEYEAVKLSVELVATDGVAAKIPLERIMPVPPKLRSRFSRMRGEKSFMGQDYEATLQLIEIPLASFRDKFPAFEPARLKTIRFVFDRSPKGVIILDNIGFAGKRADRP